jgi:sulfhydrogenase subunit beta (sulfur reductase)
MTDNKHYFISNKHFADFIAKRLEISKVIAPVILNDSNRLAEINNDNIDKINLYGFRTVEPFKSYFFELIQKVSEYFAHNTQPITHNLTLIGARACDIEAITIQDQVFGEGDFKDDFYTEKRKNVLIISADCTDCGHTCFCNLVKGQPYPIKNFDINLTATKDGYIAEVGSKKGQDVVEEHKGNFVEAYSNHMDVKEKIRKRTVAHLEEVNKKYPLRFKISETHKANLTNEPLWKDVTKTCVECSACNFICPSCTCFLLIDQEKDKDSERYKVWDACLKSGYAKVAGGANSRGKLADRLQNRYHCKFDYSFERLGRYTCVGCGRCIDGCAGNIDMRNVFKELEKKALFTAILMD